MKPGVQVLTPNPFTSGGARWNVLAAYGAQIAEQGRSEPAQAQAYLKALFKNVPVRTTAGDALQTFSSGKGDALLSYENEAITAQNKGSPSSTPSRPDDPDREPGRGRPKTRRTPSQAKAFVGFLLSPAGQRISADAGYRPVLKSALDAKRFPTPTDLFTTDKLGGLGQRQRPVLRPRQGHRRAPGSNGASGVNPAAK